MKKYNFFKISRAEGSLLYDKEGNKYIDFTSAWNVTNLGWNHPEINEAIIKQTAKNTQGLLWGSDPIQEAYAEKLTSVLPKELDACTKATGGTEAIEESIKVARAATGRRKIIGFKKSYHGQLFASMALGYSSESVERIAPLVPDFIQMDFPTKEAGEDSFNNFKSEIEKILAKQDVAAIISEPGIITGWGSTSIAFPGFLKVLRELTQKYNTLLIIDEVGTGFSRTGKLFGIEHENVVPDMIVFAKGISNGAAAIGTVVGKSAIFEATFPYVNLISTFGWTPLACAVALKTLEIHLREKTWEQAEKKGNYIIEKLKLLLDKSIINLRGLGMEIGLELKDSETARRVIDLAYKKGLHVIIGSENNIQLMPPLTIPQNLLDDGLEILIKTIEKES
ncbi:MAG: aspartate aminotransferase family protein [Planctomycetes bacterium]|jgi:4-aminobutyrate aminotransferase-like enzyme|nr:aspartate aminotransferase family protein [Planctomycetota bacterium]